VRTGDQQRAIHTMRDAHLAMADCTGARTRSSTQKAGAGHLHGHCAHWPAPDCWAAVHMAAFSDAATIERLEWLTTSLGLQHQRRDAPHHDVQRRQRAPGAGAGG
jgi:hypothetical protein